MPSRYFLHTNQTKLAPYFNLNTSFLQKRKRKSIEKGHFIIPFVWWDISALFKTLLFKYKWVCLQSIYNFSLLPLYLKRDSRVVTQGTESGEDRRQASPTSGASHGKSPSPASWKTAQPRSEPSAAHAAPEGVGQCSSGAPDRRPRMLS